VKLLAATFLAQLAILTVGAVDPFGGKVYLPSPRRYVATWLLWFVLGLLSVLGDGVKKAAGRLAALVVLATLLSETIGKKAVTFLDGVASAFPAEQPSDIASSIAPGGNLFTPKGAPA
jgi:hypothetical protein